jgi:hypothetical protein
MSIWDFRYRKSSSLKTRFVQRGSNHIEVEVGKDFDRRFDLNSERGKRAFHEEVKRTVGDQSFDYSKNRLAMDTLKKSYQQHGYSRIHRVRFGG